MKRNRTKSPMEQGELIYDEEELDCDLDTSIEKIMSPKKIRQAKEDVLLGKETKVVVKMRELLLGLMYGFIPRWEKRNGITLKKALKYISPVVLTVEPNTLSDVLVLLIPEFRKKEKFYFPQDALEKQDREYFIRFENVLDGLFGMPGETLPFNEVVISLHEAEEGIETPMVDILRKMIICRLFEIVEDKFLERGVTLDECVFILASLPLSDRGILRSILSIFFPPLEEGMRMTVFPGDDDDSDEGGSYAEADIAFRESTEHEKGRDAYQSKVQEFIFGAIENFISEEKMSRGMTKKQLVKPMKDLLKHMRNRKRISTDEALEFIEYHFPEFEDGRKLRIKFEGPDEGGRRPLHFDFK